MLLEIYICQITKQAHLDAKSVQKSFLEKGQGETVEKSPSGLRDSVRGPSRLRGPGGARASGHRYRNGAGCHAFADPGLA